MRTFPQSSSSDVKGNQSSEKFSKIVEADGYAFLSETKTIGELRQEALTLAKREALEKGQTFIRSLTKVENYQMQYDLIETSSEGNLKIIETKDFGITQDNRYHYWIKAEIEYRIAASPHNEGPTAGSSFDELMKLAMLYKVGILSTPPFSSRIGIEWVYIPGGIYEMGDTVGDGDSNEKPAHKVMISDFYLSKTEVTVAQYRVFCYMTDRPMPEVPRSWLNDSDHPMVYINWHDASVFCKWVGGRLPTESEWEYAAKSTGKSEKWAGTSQEINLGEYAWYNDNSDTMTHQVGTKKPNGLGLNDMSGNVYEWCADVFSSSYYSRSPMKNPTGPAPLSEANKIKYLAMEDSVSRWMKKYPYSSEMSKIFETFSEASIIYSRSQIHVMRGGSWFNKKEDIRCSSRSQSDADSSFSDVGFRVASSLQY